MRGIVSAEVENAVDLPVPQGVQSPTVGGQLVIEACASWYAMVAKGNPALQATLRAGKIADADAMRKALEGPNPSPIERLLVERVVVCHLALTSVEGRECGLPVNIAQPGHSHVDRLQRRYLDALKALAQVQRLRLPRAAVFVGGQHLHVEGSQA